MHLKALQPRVPTREPSAMPETELARTFPPSTELGEQIRHLQKAQEEIDRRKVEELARLRALQDRD